MAKASDFPENVREFGKLLDGFGGRFYDYDVFMDFIDYTISCLLLHGNPETVEHLKSKYGKDYEKFPSMYYEFLKAHLRLLPPDNEETTCH